MKLFACLLFNHSVKLHQSLALDGKDQLSTRESLCQCVGGVGNVSNVFHKGNPSNPQFAHVDIHIAQFISQ